MGIFDPDKAISQDIYLPSIGYKNYFQDKFLYIHTYNKNGIQWFDQ